MNKEYITVNYYKCTKCNYRVGIPEDGIKQNKSVFGNQECRMLYCNGCKEDTPHVYCGYRTVIK